MMENLKEALEYVVGLGLGAQPTEVLEIAGKTYANRALSRYDKPAYADPVKASTLTALADYIENCAAEFKGSMIVHIVSPTRVRLMSELDAERNREVLFETNAEASEFRFDQWYNQEDFIINLQANFQPSNDLEIVMKVAGNIEQKNDQSFSDDGCTQVATMRVGIASKAEAIVPNPVELIPYRTFQEVPQPTSKFVFRIGSKEAPAFKIVEAEGGIWRNEAIRNIKDYLFALMEKMDGSVRNKITVIG